MFGYGSLMWRPDFPHERKVAGYIVDYCRRFWQGSTDHRGTPEAPGRVVTLVPEPGAQCWGVVYRVRRGAEASVLAQLDHREKGGYEQMWAAVRLAAPANGERVRALTYIARDDNAEYLGPATPRTIAMQIRESRGPSGDNLEYLLELAESLKALGIHDQHVNEIEQCLKGAGSAPRSSLDRGRI